MKDWKKINDVLDRLTIEEDFYRRSLARVSIDCTEQNYSVFKADADQLHCTEKKLHELEKEE